jgi:hypothetical protein
VLIGVQTVTRAHRMHSGIGERNDLAWLSSNFCLPPALRRPTYFVIVQYASTAVWMLPGLWQIIFSLGVFSSCRFLPRAMVAAGMWYLITGLTCIALGDSRAFSPWTMGISFGAGQFLAAGILFFSASEGSHES